MLTSVIVYSYISLLIVVSIVGIFRLRAIDVAYMRRLIYLIWFSTAMELAGKFIFAYNGISNLWFFNLSIPVYALLIGSIYYAYFDVENRIKRTIAICYCIFLLYCAINPFCFQDFFSAFNSYSVLVMSVFVVFCVFLYFRHKLKNPSITSLQREAIFWISSGLMLFYGAQVFAIGSINYFNGGDKPHIASAIGSIIQLLNIPMNLLFLIALLCLKPLPKSS